MWPKVYDAARFCDNTNGRTRLIVVELMLIRGIGELPSSSSSLSSSHPKLSNDTSDGRLFVDMPLLAHDLTRLHALGLPSMAAAQRNTLHSFVTTLAGAGLDDRLCGIGMQLLSEALETHREQGTWPLAQTGSGQVHGDRQLDSWTAAELSMPAPLWLSRA